MQNMLWCAFCQVSALVLKKVILSQLSPIPHPSFDQKNLISCNEKMFLSTSDFLQHSICPLPFGMYPVIFYTNYFRLSG